jgi:hypothetical protein
VTREERPDDLVELAKFAGEPEASVVVAQLEAEGIPARVLGGHLKNTNLFFALSLQPSVVVRRDQLEAARAVLGELAPPEGWEDEAETMEPEDGDTES